MNEVLYIKIREGKRVFSEIFHTTIEITKDDEHENIGYMIQSEESERT